MMTHRILVAALIAAVLPLQVAVSQERQTKGPCAGAKTTIEMLDCLRQRYQKVDAELNRVYKQLMSRLTEKRQAKLKEAQRAWIVFRDKSAEFEASAEEGGSMALLINLLVMTEKTESRVDELKRILQETDSLR
jgi:uncharacterized protein YecT (DUF1311 family)